MGKSRTTGLNSRWLIFNRPGSIDVEGGACRIERMESRQIEVGDASVGKNGVESM